jgi:integrase/recombinase XerD
MTGPNPFPGLLESFFLDRLMRQRQASPHTLASYRDTFRLLLQYAQQQLHKAPSQVTIPDLDTVFLGRFLDHLEHDRANSARSRNVRLAALHSFFRYVAWQAPEYSAVTQRVLAIPSKRYVRRPIGFLTSEEIDALLAVPDLTTWSGRRDRALLLLTVQTGLRAAEVIGLRCEDLVLGRGGHVQCVGKECHAYCISFRCRDETTGTHAARQACDLASSLADVLRVVHTGTDVGRYTDAHGAGRGAPRSAPWAA